MKLLIILTILATSLQSQAPIVNRVLEVEKTDNSLVNLVSLKIEILAGNVKNKESIAKEISLASVKYGVETEVLVALLMVESTFRQGVVSKTGDIGIGQINPRVWSKEFSRRGLERLDVERLKTDMSYAVDRTAQILGLMKKAGYKDYYGVYHSKTKEHRVAYTKRVKVQIGKINKGLSVVLVADNN